jgi:hypothetical protein
MNENPSKSFSFLASVSPGRRYDTYWLAEAIQIVPSSLYNRKNEMCRVGKRNAMVLVENEM